ncbi:hypothetical protein MNEG_6533 [Monoraphidium neglectum]|uniref:Tetratricopeptide repeat protein n=1 Tax=Monoraphidium neglectum TaxID=145388 RepID=A0A0D2ME17_9CHLO|nr:hypothetical protein MNEG_6533 [Monoraphidium neglectum]KIZ01430.1 hypothetical protein MNEG_6533 [Monoraphidium neglectum]|eukprot:XP_013900449.1 hypothetical protein MNEG_6533 [Monoraphidium neglectum]
MKVQLKADRPEFQMHSQRRTAIALLATAAAAAACAAPPIAIARIATEEVLRQKSVITTGGFNPSDVPAARTGPPPAPRDAPAEPSGRGADPGVRPAVQEALGQLRAARAAAEEARWGDALREYSSLVNDHPDLALATYGRLGRAIMLYQAGEVSKAVILLDELELTARGTPEVHAALAAVLWAERPSQRLRAEQQFEIALEFDRRYSDLAYMREQRHWPPRLLAAMARFQQLQT